MSRGTAENSLKFYEKWQEMLAVFSEKLSLQTIKMNHVPNELGRFFWTCFFIFFQEKCNSTNFPKFLKTGKFFQFIQIRELF